MVTGNILSSALLVELVQINDALPAMTRTSDCIDYSTKPTRKFQM
jgi:hypothetical protein